MSEPGPTEAKRLIQDLGNDDVRWDGTLVGLVPTVVGDPARRLLTSDEDVLPLLVDAVADESKFVVAHVLLTLLSEVEHDATPWNGLRVDLSADGEVRVDPEQRFALARRWRAWHEATPRPRSLPSPPASGSG
jgi:hypothetical protein